MLMPKGLAPHPDVTAAVRAVPCLTLTTAFRHKVVDLASATATNHEVDDLVSVKMNALSGDPFTMLHTDHCRRETWALLRSSVAQPGCTILKLVLSGRRTIGWLRLRDINQSGLLLCPKYRSKQSDDAQKAATRLVGKRQPVKEDIFRNFQVLPVETRIDPNDVMGGICNALEDEFQSSMETLLDRLLDPAIDMGPSLMGGEERFEHDYLLKYVGRVWAERDDCEETWISTLEGHLDCIKKLHALDGPYIARAYQRCGFGTILLQLVLNFARKVNSQIVLRSTPQALAMFEFRGWKEIHFHLIDLQKEDKNEEDPAGGDEQAGFGLYRVSYMIGPIGRSLEQADVDSDSSSYVLC